jgi:hypothetical protein
MKEFNNDKDIFNKSIKKRFETASVEPSDSVWEGIEGALLKHENVKMQKRAVFYRNIAAAVVIIAAVSIYFNVQEAFNGSEETVEIVDITTSSENMGTKGMYANQSDVISPPQVLLDKTPQSNNTLNENVKEAKGVMNIPEPSNTKSSDQQLLANGNGSKEGNSKQEQLFTNFQNGESNESLALVNKYNDTKANLVLNEMLVNDNSLSGTIVLNDGGIKKMDNIKPGVIEDYGITAPDLEVREVTYFAISNLNKSNTKDGSSFAFQSAFNVGSGSFNPNANVSLGAPQPGFAALNAPSGTAGRTSGDAMAQDQYSAERQIVDDLSNAPIRSNVSMTFGVHFGVRLSDRLKVRTGLQYGNYRSSTESSAVIRDINSDQIFPYHGASNATELADGKIVNITSEYNVHNDFQILSVPLIVSYKFLDRKFGIGLVAGATADILLRNTIRGGDDQISEISFENNESQSYKSLFYSGVAGVEFSYNFSKNYSLSLTPTYKKAFMNITNDNASFNSAPDFLSVDMSIQFTF